MMGSDTERSRTGEAGAAWRAGEQSAARLCDIILMWLQRARERRQLDELGEHLLKDVGVSRADVEREVRKPFWRP
jgi:uncharacterized protein YjiS (DUF1127 family)